MIKGTRVMLIEEEVGQDPDCPIPTGTVVHEAVYQCYNHRPVPAGEIPVRWDQPDFLPEVDSWPESRLQRI